jgi:hypothetical protein
VVIAVAIFSVSPDFKVYVQGKMLRGQTGVFQ